MIGVCLYLAKNIEPELRVLKWLFLLLVVPLLAAMSSVALQDTDNCLLVYDNLTQTVDNVCTGEVSSIALWLVKITVWLMYIEGVLMIIGLLYLAFSSMKKKGAYFK